MSPSPFLVVRVVLFLLAGLACGGRASAQDVTPPAVTIKTPGRSAKAPGGTGTVTVTGTAKDDVAVARVRVEVPGGAAVDATLTATADPRAVTWEATLPAVLGRNTVQATAFDAGPNASRVRVKNFTFIKLCDVGVATVGDGTVNRRSATWRVGRTLRAVATARAGFLFEKWEVDGAPAAATRLFDFVVPDAPAASLTAVFVPNPYAPLSGNYNQVLRAAGVGNGFFTLRLNSNGSFSVSARGDSYRVVKKGYIDIAGTAHFSIARRGKLPLTLDVAADYAVAGGLGGVTVRLRDEQTGVESLAEAARYLLADNLPGALTLALRPGAGVPGAIQGSGYATATRAKTGSYRLSAVLPDGTPWSFGAFVIENGGGQLPVFVRIKGGGLVQGGVDFEGSRLEGGLQWSVPAHPTRAFTGFDGDLEVRGAAYVKPVGNGRIAPHGSEGRAAVEVLPALPETAIQFTQLKLATFNAGSGGGGTLAIDVPGGRAPIGRAVIATIDLPSGAPASGTPTSIVLAGSIFGTSLTRVDADTVSCRWFIPAGTEIGFADVRIAFGAESYTLTRAVRIVENQDATGRVLLFPGSGIFSVKFPDAATNATRTARGVIVQEVVNGAPDYALGEGFSRRGGTSDRAELRLFTAP